MIKLELVEHVENEIKHLFLQKVYLFKNSKDLPWMLNLYIL